MSAAEVPACLAVAVGILVACIVLAARAVWQRRRRPVLVAPIGQDVTHGEAPADPPERAQYEQTAAGIWGEDILNIPRPRPWPRVDWQAQPIDDRRN